MIPQKSFFLFFMKAHDLLKCLPLAGLNTDITDYPIHVSHIWFSLCQIKYSV